MDFHVAGKPNPPPVNLTHVWMVQGSEDDSKSEAVVESTDATLHQHRSVRRVDDPSRPVPTGTNQHWWPRSSTVNRWFEVCKTVAGSVHTAHPSASADTIPGV